MSGKVVLILLYVYLKNSHCQTIDLNVCPNGLTSSPSDSQWPQTFPDRFEIFSELTTDVEAFEITQLFRASHNEAIHLRNHETNVEIYQDFNTYERFTIYDDLKCDRFKVDKDEYASLIADRYLKPSILLGFTTGGLRENDLYANFMGREIIRDGITTKKFQSCFYVYAINLTINATYYLEESRPHEIVSNEALGLVQIDVRSTDSLYTYNIIRFVSNPSINIVTPSGVFCPDRTSTKKIPENLPSRLILNTEAYTHKLDDSPSRIESFTRTIDEELQIERIDYHTVQAAILPALPSSVLIDYSTNLNYMYTRQTEQCTVMHGNSQPMPTTAEMIIEFDNTNGSIDFQYTGLVDCGRKHIQCHRWIGQRRLNSLIGQYEWYWAAKYDNIDLLEMIPIKVNILNIQTLSRRQMMHQEANIFNYNAQSNPIETLDTTLGGCYRALGPSHNFNYAILRMTLDNDAQYPVHRHLLSLERRLHIQLAIDLQIRYLRLSSFVIDTTRDTTDSQDKDVYVTFTLLDNPPVLTIKSSQESSSLEVIRRLAQRINNGEFYVRDSDGGFELRVRPNSLRTLVLYLLPSENHTNYFNETLFTYHNVTQTVIKYVPKIVYTHTGPRIAAFWTGFSLLGAIVAIAIGSFVVIRKWTPTVNNQ